MTRLSADENAVLQYDPSAWRLLLADEYDRETTLLEVMPGRSIHLDTRYAGEQRITATLNAEDIAQVVVGWSEEDSCWHLGMILAPMLADQRGGRWVGLARLYDPTASAQGELIQEAGQALAAAITQPFKLIPPRRVIRKRYEPLEASEEAPEADGITEDYMLPDLPLRFGVWLLERMGDHFTLTRTDPWRRSGLLGVLWYLFWAVAFIAVSIATITNTLALPFTGFLMPEPQLLPYFGLLAGAIILWLVLRAILRLRNTVSRVDVSTTGHTVTAYSGERTLWQHHAREVQDVYVSQIVGYRGQRQHIQYGEINLRLTDGRFEPVVQQEHEQEKIVVDREIGALDSIAPLRDIETELQAAAAYIAEALGDLTCIYDQRKP